MKNKLNQAIVAIKSGDKQAGYKLLVEVVKDDPENETAWLWLAYILDDPTKKKKALYKVLKINPHNETAIKQLRKLTPTKTDPPPTKKKKGAGLSLSYIVLPLLGCLGLIYLITIIKNDSSPSEKVIPTTISPTSTTSTQNSYGQIPVTTSELINHYEQNHNLKWIERPRESDGRYHYSGSDNSRRVGRRKLVLWADENDSENINNMFYAFDFDLDGIFKDEEISEGNAGLFDTLDLVFPDWDERVDWVVKAYKEDLETGELVTGKPYETQTTVNGIKVMLSIYYENDSGLNVVFLEITE